MGVSRMSAMKTFLLFCFITLLSASPLNESSEESREQHYTGDSFKFLVGVNDTWGSCFSLVDTPMMAPNRSLHITVAKCDAGPLIFQVNKNGRPDGSNQWSKYSVWLEFRSSVIEDASPPTCTINFNGTFVLPGLGGDDERLSPLPGCFTADSREGFHMTYYWFYLYLWPGSQHGLLL